MKHTTAFCRNCEGVLEWHRLLGGTKFAWVHLSIKDAQECPKAQARPGTQFTETD
jgi:hypothetical protein